MSSKTIYSNGYDNLIGLHLLFQDNIEYEIQSLPIQNHINNLPFINDDIEHNQNEILQVHDFPIANDPFLDILNDSGISYDSDNIVNTVNQNFIERIKKFRSFLQINTEIWSTQFELFNQNGQELIEHYPILTPFIQDLSWMNQKLDYYIRQYHREIQNNSETNNTFHSDSEDENENQDT